MQALNYHALLAQQLEAIFGEGADLPHELAPLLDEISGAYARYDNDLKASQALATHRTEQLIASTSQAYSFLDSIHKGFVMCDTGGEVVLTNRSFRDMLQLKTGTIGSYVQTSSDKALTLEVIDGIFRPVLQLQNMVHECLKSGQLIERDDVAFGKGFLRVYLTPLVNGTSPEGRQLLGAVILIEDITAQKMLERSKDEFLSIASHELRTPLTAIRGNTSLIKKYYAQEFTDKQLVEMIDDIHTASERLIGIVHDFLDVAALEQGKFSMQPEVFQLQEIVQEVVRELGSLCAEKNIGLQADASVAQMPPVKADRQRIKQVLINLVGNAIKFTEQGGITFSAQANDRFVRVTVSDTGRGMSVESQQLLFKKFSRAGDNVLTRDTTKGTGLGLYISKLIIEQTGGTIGLVSSEPGKGSDFAFTLPRVPESGE